MRKKIFKGDPKWDAAISNSFRATAWRSLQRGWIFSGYHKRNINIDLEKFDANFATRVAGVAWARYGYMYRIPEFLEESDIKQEIVLRLMELSGDERTKVFVFSLVVAKNVIRNQKK